MAFDASRLTSTLSQSKIQAENQPLHQVILDLINGANEKFVDFDALLASIQATISGLAAVVFVDADTSTVAPTFILDDYCKSGRPVVFKDVLGNAAANNITLTGTVDGVANPVINTNFGVMRVYKNLLDGAFNQW